MSNVCGECGQHIQEAHKEVLTKQKLTMLKAAAAQVMATDTNNFMNRDIAIGHSAYGNLQKLRYHGLITPARDAAGRRVKGHWLVTRNGWAFLRGELSLPKFVLVKNNRIEGRSDTLISVRDVYYGSEAIQTTFEYFDDAGHMVGFRPLIHQESQQVSMI